MAAKTGRINYEAVGVECPDCGEPCASNSTGSHMFAQDEYKAGEIVTCSGCGAKVKCPADPWDKKPRKKRPHR